QADQLRHGSKARYGWMANPYRKPLLIFLPTGTFTLQDTPSFPRRDNDRYNPPKADLQTNDDRSWTGKTHHEN
ncbi:MAG: hypothetical protein B6I32_09145, partial [Desulfobacterium sp. 4572_20]